MTRELSAKSAAALLRESFSAKGALLSHTEALDLFAKLKGFNAWSHMQHATAKCEEESPETVVPVAAPKKFAQIRLPEVLAQHYGAHGELAILPRAVWRTQDQELDYWDWVEHSIDEDDAIADLHQFTFVRDNQVSVTLPDGTEAIWDLEKNLTDRWGSLNPYVAERKPGLAILSVDAPLLEQLCAEMYDETTFVARKDGHFGLYYEVEYCSIESESECGDDDVERKPHAVVVANLLEGLKKLELLYPNVAFCVPDASHICNDRPAVWAFVKTGSLSETERAALGDALFAL